MKILQNNIRCLCTEEEFTPELAETFPEIYIQGSGGVLYKHQSLIGGRHVRMKLDKVPAELTSASNLKEEINYLPSSKIPVKLLNQIVKLFKDVMKKYNTNYEAHCFILYNKDKGYYISVPEQSVGGASVTFSYDKATLPAGDIIALDIHSHNSMGSFFSGTDDRNDMMGIYYSGVVGNLDKDTPTMVFRFNFQGVKREVKVSDIFDIQEPEVDIDQSWLDKIKAGGYPGYNVPGVPEYRGAWAQRHQGSTTYPMLTGPNKTTSSPKSGYSEWESGRFDGWDSKGIEGGWMEDIYSEAYDEPSVGFKAGTFTFHEPEEEVLEEDTMDEIRDLMMGITTDNYILEILETAYHMLSPSARSTLETNGLSYL